MSPSTPFAEHLRAVWRRLAETGRLIVGVPDYDTYLAHMRRTHPDRPAMTREQFFAERMRARYGRGASRCC